MAGETFCFLPALSKPTSAALNGVTCKRRPSQGQRGRGRRRQGWELGRGHVAQTTIRTCPCWEEGVCVCVCLRCDCVVTGSAIISF